MPVYYIYDTLQYRVEAESRDEALGIYLEDDKRDENLLAGVYHREIEEEEI